MKSLRFDLLQELLVDLFFSVRFRSEVLAVDSLIRDPSPFSLSLSLSYGRGFRPIIGRYCIWDGLTRLSERIFTPVSSLICHYLEKATAVLLLGLWVVGVAVLLACSLNWLNHQHKICCVPPLRSISAILRENDPVMDIFGCHLICLAFELAT